MSDLKEKTKSLTKLYEQAMQSSNDELIHSDGLINEVLGKMATIFNDETSNGYIKELNSLTMLLFRPMFTKYITGAKDCPVEKVIKQLVHRYLKEALKRQEVIFLTLAMGVDFTNKDALDKIDILIKGIRTTLEQQIQEVDAALAVVKK